jgi:2-polyprenyl-3-methyl-5-hydroxy-6-metoxy-1,4-benzoquinol methylase
METHDRARESCPYCNSIAVLDFCTHTSRHFRCGNCDLIFKGNRRTEDKENLAKYYEKGYFADQSHDQLNISRNELYSRILDRIEREIRSGKLLDVGCGCGFFLKKAMGRGWNIAGIDPSHDSIAYSEDLLGDAIARKGTLTDINIATIYDVITMINVLDHSLEPWADVEKARDLLNSGGIIFLRFPNGIIHSALYKISKKINFENFVFKYLVFHEYSFTQKFIRKLLNDNSFSIIEIRNASLSGGTFFNLFLKRAIEIFTNSLSIVSAGRILLGPSLEVMARKP